MTMNKERPKIIAEISCNHNQDITVMEQLISSAKGFGADLVKIQTYYAEEMCIDENYTIEAGSGTPWDGQKLFDLYNKGATSFILVERAFRYAKKVGIPLFSSVFSIEGLEYLEKLGCPMYKIASFENNHYELINKVSQTKKPLIVSTGTTQCFTEFMGIKNACVPDTKLIFMHCISAYPTYNNEANIHVMKKIKDDFGNDVGFSDHTRGDHAAMAATVLGAKYIEKHLHMGMNVRSLDKDFSLDPFEFAKYAQNIHDIHRSLYADHDPQGPYREFKRSIYVTKSIKKGEEFTKDNIGVYRPYEGLDPIYLPSVLGKTALHDISSNSPLLKTHVKGLDR